MLFTTFTTSTVLLIAMITIGFRVVVLMEFRVGCSIGCEKDMARVFCRVLHLTLGCGILGGRQTLNILTP